MRDIRDPHVLGDQLLRERVDGANRSKRLTEVYDSAPRFFERMPNWSDDGFMSSSPTEHHSKTPQGDNWQGQ